jgi:hypothetical protein
MNASMSPISVCVLRDKSEIEVFRDAWQQLQLNDERRRPENDIERYLAVIEALNARPYVVVIMNGERITTLVLGRQERRQLKYKFGYISLFQPELSALTIGYGGIIGNRSDQIIICITRRDKQNIKARRDRSRSNGEVGYLLVYL